MDFKTPNCSWTSSGRANFDVPPPSATFRYRIHEQSFRQDPTARWPNGRQWPSTKNGTKQVSKGNRTYGLDDLITGSFAMHHVPIRSIALDATQC